MFTEKPTVSLKISDQSNSVAHGNTITLQAEIKSYPAPSCIRWTRMKNTNNEEIIDKSGKFTTDRSDPSCPRLTIENLDFNDNGNYIINVTNDLGCMTAMIEIKIEGKHGLYTCNYNLNCELSYIKRRFKSKLINFLTNVIFI